MGRKGSKSQPATPSKSPSNKKSSNSTPKAKIAAPNFAAPVQKTGGTGSAIEEELITSSLISVVFSAVFVGGDAILHANFSSDMEGKEMVLRAAICWLLLAPVVLLNTRYRKSLWMRAAMFVFATAVGQQVFHLTHHGAVPDQLKYGAYGAVMWAYCVFTMPLLDALVSIGGVAGYFVHTGDVDLPPQVELKLRILSAQLEQRTGYKLL